MADKTNASLYWTLNKLSEHIWLDGVLINFSLSNQVLTLGGFLFEVVAD